MGTALSIAWYHVRATFRRRRGGYLSIVLLIGLLGGVAMAAVAGARRTQSTFPAYLAATRASNLEIQASSNSFGFSAAQIVAFEKKLAQLPGVARVDYTPNLLVAELGKNGKALAQSINQDEVSTLGSGNGEYYAQDRVVAVKGRIANPRSTNEIMASPLAARFSHWHVGETIPLGSYTDKQVSIGTFNPITEDPATRFSAKLVGIVVLSSQIVNDDVDRYPTDVIVPPALTRRLRASEAYPAYGLLLDRGNAGVPQVEREIVASLPRGTTYTFHVTAVDEGEVERSSKPEAIALGVFGGIAALAALLIAGLAISRMLWVDDDDLDVLRALGAGPLTLIVDSLVGLLGAIVLGAVLALALAVGLSPLAPIGPSRDVDPTPGVALDWTVLGLGLGVLVLGLGALALLLTFRQIAGRRGSTASELSQKPSSVVNAAVRSGMPAPAVTGLRFAIERGHGRSAVPVRSALIGAVLAVVVVVTTFTFASGLSTLDSHPALYGWNWNLAIDSPGGNAVPPVTLHLLDHDPDVSAWSGVSFADVQVNGQATPALIARPPSPVGPPILSGKSVTGDHEVVLGAATLAAVHAHVGGTVIVSYGSPKDAPVYVPPTRMKVVGTATMPAIGASGALHVSMGVGVMFNRSIEPSTFQQAIDQSDPNLNGPDMVLIRDTRGVSASAARASLQRIVIATDQDMTKDTRTLGETFAVLGVQRPAEIVNYESTGATPALLAAGLAAGSIIALGLTLAASVRRRRRDLAMLKTLGFTRRQLAVTVACQASVAALVGVIIGIPVGIALGRWLWDLFARAIYAVPAPSVPVPAIALVALGALILANLVAAIPGRMAARTPTALVLRAE